MGCTTASNILGRFSYIFFAIILCGWLSIITRNTRFSLTFLIQFSTQLNIYSSLCALAKSSIDSMNLSLCSAHTNSSHFYAFYQSIHPGEYCTNSHSMLLLFSPNFLSFFLYALYLRETLLIDTGSISYTVARVCNNLTEKFKLLMVKNVKWYAFRMGLRGDIIVHQLLPLPLLAFIN